VPRGGGLLIWVSVLLVTLGVWGVANLPEQFWNLWNIERPWWLTLMDFLPVGKFGCQCLL